MVGVGDREEKQAGAAPIPAPAVGERRPGKTGVSRLVAIGEQYEYVGTAHTRRVERCTWRCLDTGKPSRFVKDTCGVR